MSEGIFVINHPKLPQFRFEWHPGVRKVYLVRITGGQEHGEMFAEGIDTPMYAKNLVKAWCHGYLTRQSEAALSDASGVPRLLGAA